MQLRNFSVIPDGENVGHIVLAVSDDLQHVLFAVTEDDGVRLRRISIDEVAVAEVYFGVDDSPWSQNFLRPEGGKA